MLSRRPQHDKGMGTGNGGKMATVGVAAGEGSGTMGLGSSAGGIGRAGALGNGTREAGGGSGSVGGAENESRAPRASGASRTAAGEGTGDSRIGIAAGGCNIARRGVAAWITSYLGYKSWIAAWNSIQQAGSARASRAAAKVLHDASSV